MLTRNDLPTFLLSDTDTHVSKTGTWIYAGGGAGSWTISPAMPSPRAADSQTYIIKVRGTAGALTLNRSNADVFAYGGVTPTSITLQPGQTVILTPAGANVWEVLFAGPTVLTSPNGTRYLLGVADDGALTTTSL